MREKAKNYGVTLLEMMVVMAIAAILLFEAVPALQSLQSSIRLKSVSDTFVAHLNFARNESIKRNARVLLCKSGDGRQCADTGQWEQGWIVFHDANNNAKVDLDEAILVQKAALHAAIRFSGNANVAKYVSYTPDGGANLVSGAFQAGSFIICTPSPMEARQIVISKAGRVRDAKAAIETCQ